MTTTVVASVEAELLSSRERRTTTAEGFALCHLGLFYLREILMLSPRSHKKSALAMVRIHRLIIVNFRIIRASSSPELRR